MNELEKDRFVWVLMNLELLMEVKVPLITWYKFCHARWQIVYLDIENKQNLTLTELLSTVLNVQVCILPHAAYSWAELMAVKWGNLALSR